MVSNSVCENGSFVKTIQEPYDEVKEEAKEEDTKEYNYSFSS